jgi:hypothetical protein
LGCVKLKDKSPCPHLLHGGADLGMSLNQKSDPPCYLENGEGLTSTKITMSNCLIHGKLILTEVVSRPAIKDIVHILIREYVVRWGPYLVSK